MAKIWANWASKYGQISKIKPSDASGRDTITSVVKFGYNNHGIEVYSETSNLRNKRSSGPHLSTGERLIYSTKLRREKWTLLLH